MNKLLLFFVFLLLFSTANAQQCPVCTIDLTCDSVPAAPKLCPAELPMDTAGQYYSADLTFYIPKQFQDAQYGTVNLNQIDVLGVTGLPAGMNWTAYNYQGVAATSFYPPSNPPASERGCAKICGTPPMPFDDSITVSVLAYVTVSGVNATQNTSFKVHLKIVPNPSGNSVFSMDNSQACDSITVNFTPNLASNGSSMITYDWNFGNGNSSTNENVSQTYTVPGDYSVKCTTKVYQYVITSLSISALNNNWCGDVEEFSCTFNNPDPFFQVNNNGGITTSDTVLDKKSNITYSSLNIPLEGNQFTLYFFDADNGPPLGSVTDSLGYKTITVSGNGGNYNFTTSSPFSGTTGTVTVARQVKDTYVDSDLVHVYAPPSLTPITYTPNDTVCGGSSATLSVNSGYSSYQWYQDTLLLNGQTSSSYSTLQAGSYWVRVANSYGCFKNSNSQNVTVLPLPMASVSATGSTTFCQGGQTLLTAVPSSSYFWSNGATSQSITVTTSGNYYVVVANANGCSDTSASITITVKSVPGAAIVAGGATTFCRGDSVLLSTNQADNYLWNTGQTGQQVTVYNSGNYSVTSFLNNGCSSNSSPVTVQVFENPAPEIAVSGATSFCQGDTAVLSVSTANSYLWSNGATTQSTSIYSAGYYSVTVTDANGCAGSSEISVTDPGGPSASVSFVNASAPGACDGSATTAASGGVSPYTYAWSANANNQTTPAATGLCAGQYSVTVSDANQCTATYSVTISELTGIIENPIDAQMEVFPNPNTGTFTLVFYPENTDRIQIQLFNVLGEQVYFSSPGVTPGKILEVVSPEKAEAGIYFLRVSTGSKYFVKKIIIK